MKGLNKVILIGNLGRDPEFKEDLKRASFSMATTESYNDKSGQRVDLTEWHNIVVWGNLAEIAYKYLRKGTPIYLEGKIRSRSYDDSEGNKKYITEIRADNFIMLGGRREDDQQASTSTHSEQPYSAPDIQNIPQPDDDLPF